MEQVDALVVGAGIAGLACAGALAEAGAAPIVLERSRGVGGRCATRRVDGRPIDHGLVFLHGSDPSLLAAMDRVESRRLDGWPTRVSGSGAPCQPVAFGPGETRLAFEDGVNAFARSLARGLAVRRERTVSSLDFVPGAIEATTATGERYRAETLVLALALGQVRRLLEGSSGAEGEAGRDVVGAGRDLVGADRLLATFATVPCLTVLAGYDAAAPEPAWDVLYPEGSDILQLVSHDSAKRAAGTPVTLVLQARPAWSRRNLGVDAARWSAEMVAEAGRLIGGWAAVPAWSQAHCWRHARLEAASELSAPLLVGLEGGARLGLAGDLFAPGGGMQAAFMSGRRLADRLLGEGGA